jgi:hypothetical protein
MRDLMDLVIISFFAVLAVVMAVPAFAAGTGYGQ